MGVARSCHDANRARHLRGTSCSPCQKPRIRREAGTERIKNCEIHSLIILHHLKIGEANHAIPLAQEECRSYRIAGDTLLGVVAIPVDLDDQPGPMAGEIHHIAPDRRLLAKVPACLADWMDYAPEPDLKQRRLLAQDFGERWLGQGGSLGFIRDASVDTLPLRGEGSREGAFSPNIGAPITPSQPPPSRGRCRPVGDAGLCHSRAPLIQRRENSTIGLTSIGRPSPKPPNYQASPPP